MKKDNLELYIILNGDIFKEINEQYEKEQELMKEIHMLTTKMPAIYMEVFQCNDKIKLINAESFGCIAIDDNHIVVNWDVDGCEVEFYYEQFWDIMSMTMDRKQSEHTAMEIVRAFENYYNKKFTYNFWSESKSYNTSTGNHTFEYFNLEIFQGQEGEKHIL